MRRRGVRRALTAAAVVVFGVAAVLTAGLMLQPKNGVEETQRFGDAEMPTALAAHLEDLAKTSPGNEGLERGRPVERGGERVPRARAIRRTRSRSSRWQGVRAAVAAAKGRPFPSGKGRKGTWVSIGPSEALYPFEPFRNSFNYVPNAYVAGGRTTSIALAASCKPGDCRAYITPAGGGVWRTKNALTGEPHWEYLGGPLGINAAGSVYLDPNDASGNTVYVGTGEANICGSGCVAGTGLYKSTNGGDSWTLLGGSTFDGLGIGAIVVKPGSPNTIYAGVDDRPARDVVRLLHRRDAAGPGRREVGPVQVDQRRRVVELHPQRLDQRGRLRRRPDGVEQRPDVLAARRPLARARPVESGDRLRGLVRPRRLALAGRRRDVDADQAVAERGASSRRGRTSP